VLDGLSNESYLGENCLKPIFLKTYWDIVVGEDLCQAFQELFDLRNVANG
jgi:hypothetical protein